ncbi:T-cell surface glycoprotein CD8 alpha chain isoform X2 [Hypomesus transpacificus]|uniref:T-cell surface glycoprotein CD8 alpha chain isoform X2 n=1 Tax=Hypomesus transpacificus TaxID=137520 RepID=UPI001F072AE5|nr:T-cell surface glycoprotein CD8 alpha chain isoform X2 [Hypomesus transpacificus]
MAQSWIRQAVVLLVFCQRIPSTFGTVTEDGSTVDITCEPPNSGSMIFWFRVTDNVAMEFITTKASDGTVKVPINEEIFQKPTMKKQVTIKSFKKERDSGSYGCMSINKNELKFGEVTVLAGPAPKTEATTTKAPAKTAQSIQSTTTKSCACNSDKVGEKNSGLSCDPLMWGPLAGGCGLLVLLLIVTICYCNRVRTRRCPHHYKRQKQTAQGKQHAMATRHV